MSTADATPAAGTPAAPARRAPPKSARRRSREFALQGLYQWLVSAAPVAEVEAHIALLEHFD